MLISGMLQVALQLFSSKKLQKVIIFRYRFNLPPNLTLKNFEGMDIGKFDKDADSALTTYVAGLDYRALSWKDIAWLKTITHLPVLVKGVITAEDGKIAVQTGASGIIVSNHGARQLDYVPATIMALEEVVSVREQNDNLPDSQNIML